MPTIFIPAPLRPAADGQATVWLENAETVRDAIEQLEARYPELQNRLLEDADGRKSLRTGLQVAVDVAMSSKGLRQPLQPNSEVHFLPAIGGG